MEVSNVSQPLSKGDNMFLVPTMSALPIAAQALLLSECPKQPRCVQKGVLLKRFNFEMTWQSSDSTWQPRSMVGWLQAGEAGV